MGNQKAERKLATRSEIQCKKVIYGMLFFNSDINALFQLCFPLIKHFFEKSGA